MCELLKVCPSGKTCKGRGPQERVGGGAEGEEASSLALA